MLCGVACLMVGHGQLNQTHFEYAWQRLLKFDVVTIMDDMEVANHAIASAFGWDPKVLGHDNAASDSNAEADANRLVRET